MKKIFSIASLLLVAALAFTSCSKDETNAPEESVNKSFSIVANLNDTKVTIDNALKSSWEDGDQMNVFHAATGTTAYTNDKAFSYAEGRFTGELGAALTDGASYDWYALYPYSSYVTEPGENSTGHITVGNDNRYTQEQAGNSNPTHMAGSTKQKGVYPLVGKVSNVAANTTPSLTMSHVCSYVKVHVKNTSSEGAKISEVKVTMDGKDVIGSFVPKFTDPANCVLTKYSTFASSTATLNVVDGEEISTDGEADFYLGIAPQDLIAGDKMSVVINATYVTSGKSATQTKELTMTGSVDFKAGHIKTLNFNLSKATNITASDKTVQAGSTVAIGATVNSGATLTYSSSDNSVATVDATGTITGVAAGTATITITAPEYDGFPEATKEITVMVSAAGSAVTLLEENFDSITEGNSTGSNGSGTAWSGNDNFSANTAYAAGGAVKIGKSKGNGSLTTKTSYTVPAGKILKVQLDVKGWTSVEGKIKVTFNGIDKEIEYTALMSGSFETKEAIFAAEASDVTSTVVIATTAKRAFVDNIKIYYE